MQIIGIVAIDQNGGIGIDNKLPFCLSSDLKHFREQTTGSHIVFGRKTFESVVLLKNRYTVVLSKTLDLLHDKVKVIRSAQDVIIWAKKHRLEKIYICGGASVYKAFENHITKWIITHVQAQTECDTFYNPHLSGFKLVSEKHQAANKSNQFPFTIKTYING